MELTIGLIATGCSILFGYMGYQRGLKDGRTVSGYHLLDEETLREEGWISLEDNPPEYDVETQYLVNDGYEILEDKVI